MSKKFYAQKDALGFPIPGTMMSADTLPTGGSVIEITGVAPTLPSTSYQTHPGNLRYFVRKDNSGNIIPNSLIISLTKPAGNVVEFKLPI